ncbi:MAG: GntR family transcriptional regulator [Oscillospiraceae bacterium]|jgi:DNA-binding transcriptional regulator YhcF (GntR family)|nr:GntR family transcriptional regulator [Oscillospiraceae bacterium]
MLWAFKGDRPLYLQIIDQIKLRIISGVYPAGTRLPSVRELASEASVNPNTMQKALSELEREHLVFSQRTTGRFITEDEHMIEQVKKSLAEEQILLFFDKMEALGYDREQTLSLVAGSAKEDM